jgi:hypothetical protein
LDKQRILVATDGTQIKAVCAERRRMLGDGPVGEAVSKAG